jgi:hypothetical protein
MDARSNVAPSSFAQRFSKLKISTLARRYRASDTLALSPRAWLVAAAAGAAAAAAVGAAAAAAGGAAAAAADGATAAAVGASAAASSSASS